MSHLTRISALALGIAGALLANDGHAAAFQLKENSAKGLGRAFAGSISAPGDASVVFTNPAAMRGLDGRLFQSDLSVISFSADFSGAGTHATGAPVSGGNGGDAGTVAPVPTAYFHVPFADKHHFGMSLAVPYGFVTEYDKDWVGRYSGVKTDLRTIDLGFAYSYDVTPDISLGFNVFAERLDIELVQAVNFGAALAANPQVQASVQQAVTTQVTQAVQAGLIPAAAAPTVIAQQTQAQLAGMVGAYDGYSKLEGSETTFGYTLGALFQVTENTHVGISYRSKVEHEVTNGKVNYEYPAGNIGSTPAATVIQGAGYVNTGGKATLTIPASFTASVTHQVNDKWAVMADVSQTSWKSAFDTVTIDYDSAQPDSTLEFHYRDTNFVSVGAEYRHSDRLTFRGGLAYDETPTVDAYRDAKVPDATRKWLSLGLTWTPSERTEWTVGYTHLFVSDTKIDVTSVTGDRLVGSYDVGGDILAAGFSYKF